MNEIVIVDTDVVGVRISGKAKKICWASLAFKVTVGKDPERTRDSRLPQHSLTWCPP